jgi:hypothetical protein
MQPISGMTAMRTTQSSMSLRTNQGQPAMSQLLWFCCYGLLACFATPVVLFMTLTLSAVRAVQQVLADWFGLVLPVPAPWTDSIRGGHQRAR